MSATVHCSLIKTTLVDFPERVAAACFVSGCNLCCPYCYNAELVRGQGTGSSEKGTGDREQGAVSFDEIIAHLEKRRNVLTGFVISGGEPLLHYDFTVELIRAARTLGYKIKLDTNGTFPERLENLINDSALCPDYIALDVKTATARYRVLRGQGTGNRGQITGDRVQGIGNREQGIWDSERLIPDTLPLTPDTLPLIPDTLPLIPDTLPLIPDTLPLTPDKTITKSIEILSSLPPHAREFRTVLYPPLVGRQDIAAIAGVLPKDAAWYFAQFRNEHCLCKEAEKIAPYTDQEAKELVEYAGTLIAGARLR